MKGRCYNPTDQRYHGCGGRGIKVCRTWRDDFGSFLRDLGPAPANGILKRRDIDGDYTPENCMWLVVRPHRRSHRRSASSAIARRR
jgi:hypothetical protein